MLKKIKIFKTKALDYLELKISIPKKNRSFLLLFIVVFFSIICKAQEVKVSLNLKKEYQTIDGFGASDAWRCQFVGKNWPIEKRKQMAQWLFSKAFDKQGNPLGIGLSMWRFYISAGTTEQGSDSEIKNEWRRGESFINQNGVYDWNKQKGQQWFLQQAKEYGVEKFLAFSIAPPVFWSKNNKGFNQEPNIELNLQRKYYSDYASFLVEVLKHFKKNGVAFNYLSPINEPQWDWKTKTQEGTPATNENIATFIKQIDHEISTNKLDTKIVIPEAADIRYLYSVHDKPSRANQIQAFFSDTTSPNIKNETYIGNLPNVENTISGHSYFTTYPNDTLISTRNKLHQALKKQKLNYWQSEFCILEKSEDIGGGRPRDLGMNTALYVARVIHADLTLVNASSWQWWTSITNANYKDGLIYIDTGQQGNYYNRPRLKNDGQFHDSKLLWSFGNFSRFIRPNMQRIGVNYNTNEKLKDQYENLLISAYKSSNDKKIVVVVINYSKVQKDLLFPNKNILLKEAYTTSKSKNLNLKKVTGRSIQIEPRSVTTLVGVTK